MNSRLYVPLALIAFVVVSSEAAKAQENVYVNGWLGGSSHIQRATNTTGTVSVNDNGQTGAYTASTSFGRISASADSFYPGYPLTSGYASGGGSWSDTVTFQPDNPALQGTGGTAVFTYYLNGKASSTDYQMCQFNVSTECECGGPSTYGGTPIVSSFTEVRSFTFGAPISYTMVLSALAHGDGGEHTIEVSLTAGGVTILDGSGHAISSSSSSSIGSGREMVMTNGEAFADFSFTNALGHQTSVALLAGKANADTNLTAAFTGAPGTNGFASDEVDFSGTGTNLFVLQMSYDPNLSLAQLGDEAKTLLMWFNPLTQLWTNAISGNSDGGLASHFFLGAFDTNTEFQLGNFGVDITKHVVWAVLDHNSQFAAGGIAGTPALRLTGVLVKTNGVQVSMQGSPTAPIFIQALPDFAGTNWTEIGRAVPNADGAAIFVDPTTIVTNAQRFYRARQ